MPRKRNKFCLMAAMLSCSALSAAAQTRDAGPPPAEERLGLDSLFGSDMVLQRDRPIRLWGRAKPGERVTVSLHRSNVTVVANKSGRWRATLAAQPAGGPYALTASAASFRDRYADVMVGDVWLCAGQSNMEFRRSKAIDLAGGFAPDPGLRMLDVARRQDVTPSPHLVTLGGWKRSSSQSAANFSAVCHHFGESLRAKLGVPVGLVAASWGGTRISAFVDAQTYADRHLANPQTDPASRQNPGRVFNAMIAPIAPFALRGVLWYQGESDTHHPARYDEKLRALAASWRKAFSQPLPFIVIQLPAFDPTPADPAGNWVRVREEQRRFVAGDHGSGLVVQSDQGVADELHPPEKAVVAERAAGTAMAVAGLAKYPDAGRLRPLVSRSGPTLSITYAFGTALTSRGHGMARGFELCGEACVSVPATIGAPNRIDLAIPHGLDPRCVRYDWQDVPHAELLTSNGWPLGPFAFAVPRNERAGAMTWLSDCAGLPDTE